MTDIRLSSEGMDREAYGYEGPLAEKRTLKISFVRDVLGNFVLAIPFWAIGFSLTGGIQETMLALRQDGSDASALRVASAFCTSQDTLSTACAQGDLNEIFAD
jgi:hypothetical protein